ncbi:MAG: ATP-binding cassette domain-containing protein [Deltaproteobacteria bacterium]|nr:MAG: ATP-binding cassette domain-containing protein [Deltaproteobacteria bacterium]
MSQQNTEPHKIIFSMVKVSRVHPPQKTVLKDISLSFYYGAKIGVLGLNGAGKSSLLRIIAGEDKDFNGDVHFNSKDYTIGYLLKNHNSPLAKRLKKLFPKVFKKSSIS